MSKMSFVLPTISHSQYDLLMRAVQYYRNSCVEFSYCGDDITELYILIDKLYDERNVIE